VTETYPPEYGGGAAIYVRDICRRLADRGHEVRVLCTEAAERAEYSTRSEFDGAVRVDRMNLGYLRRTDPDGWTLGIRAWRRHQRRVASEIKQIVGSWRPDLVHYHTCRPLGEAAFLALAELHMPTVMLMHEAWLVCVRAFLLHSPTGRPCTGPGVLKCLECIYSHYDGGHVAAALKLPWRVLKLGPTPALRVLARRRIWRVPVGAIAYSRFIADRVRPHLRGPVRYVPLGVDLEHLPTDRPTRPRTPFRFGFIAGFQPTKGIADVLDAVAALKSRGLSFELHVWGPGQEQAMAHLQSRGVQDCVRLRGMYGPDEVWNAYLEMDVALMATRVVEPFGRVPQEASAVGVPSIVPAVGGLTEQIRDGVDGLLYEFANKDDLTAQMCRVLTEPGLYAKLASNLWQVVDTRDAVATIEAFYYEVLAGGPTRRS
jgi:glycosyltransferase involved in cell wall biosynthesis